MEIDRLKTEDLSEEKTCHKCGSIATHFGLNHWIRGKAEYECYVCNKNRKDAYDAYVDPVGWYH